MAGAFTLLDPAGRVAAQNMLAQEAEISTVPYLWTAMFGKSLRYAGNRTSEQGGAKVLPECRGGAWSWGGATSILGRGHDSYRKL